MSKGSVHGNRYRELFRYPGGLLIVLSALIARLPIGALALAMILSTKAALGNFASAGLVAGVFAFSSAVMNPLRGRLMDQFGIFRSLLGLSIANAVALTAFGLLLQGLTSLTALMVTSVFVGMTMPPVGQAVRAYWNHKLEASTLRSTAYAIESVSQELTYILGPLVTTLLMSLGAPNFVFFLAAAMTLIGSLTVALLAAESHVPVITMGRFGDIMYRSAVRLLVGSMFLIGLTLGVLDVALPAFSTSHGQPGEAGIFLACLAFGSALGGVWYGIRAWHSPLKSRTATFAFLFGALLLPGAFAQNQVILSVILGCAGFTLAPIVTGLFLLTDNHSERHTSNEAQSWVGSAYIAGVALGAVLGGWIIDLSYVGSMILACAASVCAAFSLTRLPSDQTVLYVDTTPEMHPTQ